MSFANINDPQKHIIRNLCHSDIKLWSTNRFMGFLWLLKQTTTYKCLLMHTTDKIMQTYPFSLLVLWGTNWSVCTRPNCLEILISMWNDPVRMIYNLSVITLWNIIPIAMRLVKHHFDFHLILRHSREILLWQKCMVFVSNRQNMWYDWFIFIWWTSGNEASMITFMMKIFKSSRNI